jgi:predicted HTH transcriptional regulator
VSLVNDAIGPQVSPYYKIRFEHLDGREVCVIDVDRASERVFAKTEKGKEFYVRSGNTTKSLDPEQTQEYIEQHWP